jgi:Flp pilus assembly protein TadG
VPTLRPSQRLTAALVRFLRARRGAMAVEFALVVLPFLVMLFAVLELGLVFMVSTSLENATEAAGRRIRTGEFQTSGSTSKADFKTVVCNNMTWLASSCTTNLYVDVRTFADFTTLSNAPALAGAGFNPNATCWSPGEPTDIVLVRTYYEWTLITPLLNAALENKGAGSGKRLISAMTTFRNEPYNANAPKGASC